MRSRITESESAELDGLHAKVWQRNPETGLYYHWSRSERDRVHELTRKRYPAATFAPSTEEMARRFGYLARTKPGSTAA